MSHPAKKRKKRDMISFDPPEDVRILLEKAQKATGADRTMLIVEAIRTDLEKVVRKLIAERRKAEEDFFEQARQNNPAEADPPKKRATS